MPAKIVTNRGAGHGRTRRPQYGGGRRRQASARIDVALNGESVLLQVVAAIAPSCRLAGALYCRQEESDQHRDDRDHDEQFDEREATMHATGLGTKHDIPLEIRYRLCLAAAARATTSMTSSAPHREDTISTRPVSRVPGGTTRIEGAILAYGGTFWGTGIASHFLNPARPPAVLLPGGRTGPGRRHPLDAGSRPAWYSPSMEWGMAGFPHSSSSRSPVRVRRRVWL